MLPCATEFCHSGLFSFDLEPFSNLHPPSVSVRDSIEESQVTRTACHATPGLSPPLSRAAFSQALGSLHPSHQHSSGRTLPLTCETRPDTYQSQPRLQQTLAHSRGSIKVSSLSPFIQHHGCISTTDLGRPFCCPQSHLGLTLMHKESVCHTVVSWKVFHNQLREKALFCSVCQFPWCKHSTMLISIYQHDDINHLAKFLHM